MKKTLIAASIAALAATSANAAVKIYESETGSLSSYGKIQLELQNYDGENNIQNNGSRFGFAGDQKLDNGLEAFVNFEFRFDPGLEDQEEITVRNSYLGVKGDFGSVKAGNFDSIVYSMVTEQADIMENAGYRSLDEGKNNARATAIAYETNDLAGFKLGLGIKHYASDKSKYGTGAGTPAGTPLTSTDGKEQWNLQVAATYQLNEELSFGLGVDQNNKKGQPVNLVNGKTKPIIAAGVNYETEQFGAGLVVEQTKDIIVTNLTGSVNYGAGDVYALVSFKDDSRTAVDKNGVDFGLGANYNLSDDFFVYGEVAVGNDDLSDIQDVKDKGTTAVTVGAAYKW